MATQTDPAAELERDHSTSLALYVEAVALGHQLGVGRHQALGCNILTTIEFGAKEVENARAVLAELRQLRAAQAAVTAVAEEMEALARLAPNAMAQVTAETLVQQAARLREAVGVGR